MIQIKKNKKIITIRKKEKEKPTKQTATENQWLFVLKTPEYYDDSPNSFMPIHTHSLQPKTLFFFPP